MVAHIRRDSTRINGMSGRLSRPDPSDPIRNPGSILIASIQLQKENVRHMQIWNLVNINQSSIIHNHTMQTKSGKTLVIGHCSSKIPNACTLYMTKENSSLGYCSLCAFAKAL